LIFFLQLFDDIVSQNLDAKSNFQRFGLKLSYPMGKIKSKSNPDSKLKFS